LKPPRQSGIISVIKQQKPLRTAMRALRFHRRINGKQTKRQPDRHQVRNAGQTEEPL